MKTNAAYIDQELKQDILILQEHWLFSFEKDSLPTYTNSYQFHAKASDEYNNIDATERPRGHGGVATLWTPQLDPYVEKVEDGNERILVTLFNLPQTPLCIINCYLPSSYSDSDSYRECLDMVSEIVCKYQTSHMIIIGGDMNADIVHRNNIREKSLLKCMKDLQLIHTYDPIKATQLYTYKHQTKKDTSLIDYFLIVDGSGEILMPETNILQDAPTNTSTHMAVELSIKIKKITSSKPKTVKDNPEYKFKWKEADLKLYRVTIQEEIQNVDFNLIEPENSTTVLQQIIHTALLKAAPSKKNRKQGPKRKVWSQEIKEAARAAKIKYGIWKSLGKPPEHPANSARKLATKEIRKLQRQEVSWRQQQLQEEIMEAKENDPSTMHRIIKAQRKGKKNAPAIRWKDKLITKPDEAACALAEHYQNLATPTEDQNFDKIFFEIVKGDIDYIIDHLCKDNSPNRSTTDKVEKAIKKLNSGKAADASGIQAEFLKAASQELSPALNKIFDKIFKARDVPTNLKSGYKVSIPKKGKDQMVPGNHRGITITKLIGKTFEHVVADNLEEEECLDTHPLQYGFTRGLSPTMSALGVTEVMAETKNINHKIRINTIDAQKAFDTVDHNILFRKLHLAGVPDDLWGIVKSLHTDCREHVRWQGASSEEYTVSQGVRQGGVLSTTLYKYYINDLLHQLEDADLGVKLGTTYMGCPTCADDVVFASENTEEMQVMLNICSDYANKHRYKINPTKSTTTIYPENLGKAENNTHLVMGEDKIPNTKEFTHLGITRCSNRSKPDINDRITSARKSAYSLMGTGLHGGGLNPIVSLHMIETYVIPRLLYGLDAVILNKTDVNKLSLYHRKLLKQIQGLPDRTPSTAIYLLLGAIPVEAHLHIKILSLFGAITRLDKNNPLHKIMIRQMAINDGTDSSWFCYAQTIANKYKINLHTCIHNPWTKLDWKRFVNNTIKDQWRLELLEESQQKQTMAYLYKYHLQYSGPNPIWTSCGRSTYHIRGANVRTKIATSTFPVRASYAGMSEDKDKTCLLCGEEEETLSHFTTKCKALQTERITLHERLAQEDTIIPNDRLFSIIMSGYVVDRCTHVNANSKSKSNKCRQIKNYDNINKIINAYCLNIDLKRQLLQTQEEVPRNAGGFT